MKHQKVHTELSLVDTVSTLVETVTDVCHSLLLKWLNKPTCF